jgi:hypothetical protein
MSEWYCYIGLLNLKPINAGSKAREDVMRIPIGVP